MTCEKVHENDIIHRGEFNVFMLSQETPPFHKLTRL